MYNLRVWFAVVNDTKSAVLVKIWYGTWFYFYLCHFQKAMEEMKKREETLMIIWLFNKNEQYDQNYSTVNINNYHRMIRAWKRIEFLSIENILITTCKLILW